MKKMKSVAMAALGAFALLATQALSQTPPPDAAPAAAPAGAEAKCLSCHAPENSAQHGSPSVDTHALKSGIHKDVGCVECHADAETPGPNQPEGAPHVKDLARVTCGTKCHTTNGPTAYKDSIHGRLAQQQGDKDVANCQDCHGAHDILACEDPNSKVAKCNLCQGCAKCHENQELVNKHNIHKDHPCIQWETSVHGRPRMVNGVPTVPAACTDCHGVHSIQGMGADVQPARQPETCGKCHQEALADYMGSIHGQQAVMAKNPDAPLCVDCHGEHDIMEAGEAGSSVSHKKVPETCASCHARPELMKKYGIDANKVDTFINSYHGIALDLNSKAAADCSDCHGHHKVLPQKDAASTVNPNNLSKTCGQPGCHPNMPQSIAKAKIHVDVANPKSGAAYWVRIVLVWALIILLAVSFIWVVPDMLRKWSDRRSGGKS